MNIDELKVAAKLCGDLATAWEALDFHRKENCKIAELRQQVKRLEDTVVNATNERKEQEAAARHAQIERDNVSNKFGVFCRVVNLCCVDVDKLRSPRKFLREYVAAIKKCIEENNIHFTEDGGAA